MGDDTKRVLGTGAKCCGEGCGLEGCEPAPSQPAEDDFSWGDDVVLDPTEEDE